MKPLSLICYILLLFGLEPNIMKPCFGASKIQAPFSQWQVTIVNEMRGSNMVVHCKSKDDDLGKRVLGAAAKFDWTFRENVLQSTLFWCNFKSKHGKASGIVFWPENGKWLSEKCDDKNCIWVGGDQGIYLHLGPQRGFKFVYPWK